ASVTIKGPIGDPGNFVLSIAGTGVLDPTNALTTVSGGVSVNMGSGSSLGELVLSSDTVFGSSQATIGFGYLFAQGARNFANSMSVTFNGGTHALGGSAMTFNGPLTMANTSDTFIVGNTTTIANSMNVPGGYSLTMSGTPLNAG